MEAISGSNSVESVQWRQFSESNSVEAISVEAIEWKQFSGGNGVEAMWKQRMEAIQWSHLAEAISESSKPPKLPIATKCGLSVEDIYCAPFSAHFLPRLQGKPQRVDVVP